MLHYGNQWNVLLGIWCSVLSITDVKCGTHFAGKTKRKGKEYGDKETDPMLELGVLFDLETQTSKPLKVVNNVKTMCGMEHAIFSPDENYVVLSCEDASQYAFTVDKAKWCGTVREDRLGLIGTQDERRSLRRAIHILPNGYLLTRGLSYQTEKTLYLRDLSDNLNTVKEFSGHKYGVSFIALNDAKTLAASATADTIIVNGVNTKYVYIWDLDKMEQFSVCKGQGPYTSLLFGGSYDEFVLSSGFRDSKIIVWYIGSHSKPCTEALPIYNIIGHSEDIVYMQVG